MATFNLHLTREEVLLLVAWGQVARSLSELASLPDEIVGHDFEEEDAQLLADLERWSP